MINLREAHLMLAIHSRGVHDRNKLWAELELDKSPLFEKVHVRDAVLSDGARERFGFKDGFSQPAIEGVDIDAVGGGVYVGTHPRGGIRRRVGLLLENVTLQPRPRGWRRIRTGEFLLGYENENGELPVGPPLPLGPNGTFMVYREFEQHVDVFKKYVSKAADDNNLDPAELGAKIVGRWQDGTPAVRPRPENDPTAGKSTRANEFLYHEDPNGWGCPIGAHVRRANPRDGLAGGAEQTMRHRIIRRGMPFTEGEGDESLQGLAFVCFSASINAGFEFIQRNWINNGAAFGLGSAPDFLLQDPRAAAADADERKRQPVANADNPAPQRRANARKPEPKPQAKMVIPGFRPIILEPPPTRLDLAVGVDSRRLQ